MQALAVVLGLVDAIHWLGLLASRLTVWQNQLAKLTEHQTLVETFDVVSEH